MYCKKFLNTKIKSYGVGSRIFHDKEIHKVGFNYTCLAVTLIDFVLKSNSRIKTIICKCF